MGYTLLTPSGLGAVICTDNLRHFPSMDHIGVLHGFIVRFSVEKVALSALKYISVPYLNTESIIFMMQVRQAQRKTLPRMNINKEDLYFADKNHSISRLTCLQKYILTLVTLSWS